ncbi:MAG TPA: N-acetylmuramoyl-L-alanine amidase [Pseudoxanthomonas sp.]|nr:N-acetylmuramoyl-L-alanine amidase [Pseudoxanthomonas sp.]
MPSALTVHLSPLPYESRLEPRELAQVDLAVIHCTELPDLAAARIAGEELRYGSGTGNSGHFYIDRDGSVHRYVDPARVAHHVRGHNARSVGIELVNAGRYPDWLATGSQEMREAYTDAQIRALVALLGRLAEEIPSLRYIEGHEQLDTDEVPASDDPARRVRRKRDPGPLFPWARVMSEVRLQRLAP